MTQVKKHRRGVQAEGTAHACVKAHKNCIGRKWTPAVPGVPQEKGS